MNEQIRIPKLYASNVKVTGENLKLINLPVPFHNTKNYIVLLHAKLTYCKKYYFICTTFPVEL